MLQKSEINDWEKYVPKSGKLPFRLTNDYLFRAVFQESPKALEGLCRAILRLSPEDTIEVELKNPIELGKEISSKQFVLDLAVVINHKIFMNLEMQTYHQKYWPERALSYSCRSYDNLNHGESYENVLPVYQVGFLNFSLYPEEPAFYSHYMLTDVVNILPQPKVFSDKLRISVVDLTQIDLATEEDKKYGLDRWARIFTANTWEEIHMLVKENEAMQQSVVTVAKLTEEEQIRMLCQAREDYEYWERIRNAAHRRELEERDAQISELKDQLIEKDKKLLEYYQEQEERNRQQEETILSQNSEIEKLTCLVTELQKKMSLLSKEL